MTTVYVSIGNSDDKLTQLQWHEFCQDMTNAVRTQSSRVYGRWFSPSEDMFQNACIAVEVAPDRLARLRHTLACLATEYMQDSIAFAVAETEFIAPVELGPSP